MSFDGFEPRRLALLLTIGCGTIRSHRHVEQPFGPKLLSGAGGTLLRLNKLGDLPNAFGGFTPHVILRVITMGIEHSPTSATGTGWECTAWHATQRAAWEVLR